MAGRRHNPEDAHQAALFQWVSHALGVYPELACLMHVPNGGKRGKLEAARLKRQGVRAGYPDLVLDVARGGYFGLRIELKATREDLGRKPQVSPEQRVWLQRLQEQGFRAVVCEGWTAARDEVVAYLRQHPTQAVPARFDMVHAHVGDIPGSHAMDASIQFMPRFARKDGST